MITRRLLPLGGLCLLLIAGCDPAPQPPDLGIAPDLDVPEDLRSPDLSIGIIPDLARIRDFSIGPDLRSPPDLYHRPRDLQAVPDLDSSDLQGMPFIRAITPGAGPNTGGIAIAVDGGNFLPGATVTVAGRAATNVVVVSPSRITFTLPAAPNVQGFVPVTVVNMNNTSAARADLFSYSITDLDFVAPRAHLFGAQYPEQAAFLDVDRDGRVDVVGGRKVALNAGKGYFRAGVDIADFINPKSLASADLDGDGNPDLAAVDGGTSIAVVLGRGNGTFKLATRINAPATEVALSDFNKDAVPDLLSVENGDLVVRMGNHDGTFGKATTTAVPNLMRVAAGDWNGDGRADVAVAYTVAPALGILLGKGDGTFQAPLTAPENPWKGIWLLTGDFDDDKRLDLLFAPSGQAWMDFLKGHGDGTFDLPTPVSAGSDGTEMAVAADWNGDGKLDFAVGHQAYDRPHYWIVPARVEIHLNLGMGHFGPGGVYAGTRSVLGALDADGDGHLDAIAEDAVYLGRGDSTFVEPLEVRGTETHAERFVSGDIDEDGNLDVLYVGPPHCGLVAFGDGKAGFPRIRECGVGHANHVAASDWNGDGHLDLVECTVLGLGMTVSLGQGDGTFNNYWAFQPFSCEVPLVLGDFDGDGWPDILADEVLLGLGDGSFADRGPAPDCIGARTSGDFDGDGHLDVVSVVGDLQIAAGLGDGTFAPAVPIPTGRKDWNRIAAADLDGDGNLDLVAVGGPIAVLLGNGDLSFRKPVTLPGAGYRTALILADVDGDRSIDIVSGGVRIEIRRGNGDGTFRDPIGYTGTGYGGTMGRPSMQDLLVLDLDGDGKPEILAADPGADGIEFSDYPGGIVILRNVSR